MFLDIIMIFTLLDLTISYSEVKFWSFDVMDYYSSRAAYQNFMKELLQSDLLFLSYGSGCITILNIQKTQNLTLIQEMVKINGPIMSQLCLRISKEK